MTKTWVILMETFAIIYFTALGIFGLTMMAEVIRVYLKDKESK